MTMNLRLVRCEAGDDSQKAAFDNGFKYTVDRLYEEEALRASSKNQVARDAEQRFGLGDCLYFYAGYACPRFGDIVFVFDPCIADEKQGNAGDFDSGGLSLGKIKFEWPPADLEQWASEHRWALDVWQERCRSYVSQYWDESWPSFVRGTPAVRNDDAGRLLHRENWREAWSVEVRLHADQPIGEGILRIGVTPAARIRVRQRALDDDDDSRADRWLRRLDDRIIREYETDLHGTIQEEIATGAL
jgi:hypothetical protein